MKTATVLGHRLVVPDYIAQWDAVAGFSPWEKERIDSILETMQPGDCLYDIGAEHGYMSAIFARRVGGENMVLVEPSPDLWPNIRLSFEANNLGTPIACYEGFVAGRSQRFLAGLNIDGWPASAFGPECHDSLPYRHLNYHEWLIPTATIDELAGATVIPNGITIDVEGAELGVLGGAEWTLKNNRPYVWCSIHPDLMERDFDTDSDQLQVYMLDCGYQGRLLRVDHEEHWGFWPEERDPL